MASLIFTYKKPTESSTKKAIFFDVRFKNKSDKVYLFIYFIYEKVFVCSLILIKKKKRLLHDINQIVGEKT